MRLVTYEANKKWHAGIAIEDKVIDAATAAKTAKIDFDGVEVSNRNIIQLSQA